MFKMYIKVRVQVVGMHHYPNAPGETAFLSYRHRHRFIVAAKVEVTDDDREVEFFKLQEDVETILEQMHVPTKREVCGSTSAINFGTGSCEQIARMVFIHLKYRGYKIRAVTVSEDGENEAEVCDYE